MARVASIPFGLCLAACAVAPPRGALRVHLPAIDGDDAVLQELVQRFTAANPGHGLAWFAAAEDLAEAKAPRVALLQSGAAVVELARAGRVEHVQQVGLGDVVVVDAGVTARFRPPVGLLVFELPEALAEDVPRILRPDHDPRITDTPGGCATDGAAYRRVLLTWLGKNGPYTYRGLNVHRVRIDDSFTHYHPRIGGFDEFYLVQAVREGARLLTSERTAEIEQPQSIAREDVGGLLQSTELRAGDLVYLPRGTAHRGLGGVLAQVITVPGFVPGAEIGLDHHLRAINERFALRGEAALPLHGPGADQPIVR